MIKRIFVNKIWKQLQIVVIFNMTAPKMVSTSVSTNHTLELRVAMYENPPIVYRVNNEWIGEDFARLKLVVQALNASLKIVETNRTLDTSGLQQAILENKADCAFIGIFQSGLSDDVQFSYPHCMDNVVALIPKTNAIPQSIFMVFDVVVWTSLLALFVIFTSTIKLLDNNSRLTDSFLDCLNGFLGKSIIDFQKKKSNIKMLFVIWLFGSSIIGAAFQSAFISALASPSQPKKINSIADLTESGKHIVLLKKYYDTITKDLRLYGRIKAAKTKTEFLQEFKKGDNVVVIPGLIARLWMQLDDAPSYHIMREYILPGYRVYMFKKNSPLLERIENIMMRIKDTGLLAKYSEVKSVCAEGQDGDFFLKLKHLHSVFNILLFGHIFSFIVLIIELQVALACRKRKLKFRRKGRKEEDE